MRPGRAKRTFIAVLELGGDTKHMPFSYHRMTNSWTLSYKEIITVSKHLCAFVYTFVFLLPTWMITKWYCVVLTLCLQFTRLCDNVTFKFFSNFYIRVLQYTDPFLLHLWILLRYTGKSCTKAHYTL